MYEEVVTVITTTSLLIADISQYIDFFSEDIILKTYPKHHPLHISIDILLQSLIHTYIYIYIHGCYALHA